jgi:hypothetical protein
MSFYRFPFALDMLESVQNVTYLVLTDTIIAEFPLLHSSRLSCIDLDYLIDVTENNPIRITVTCSLNTTTQYLSTPYLIFPPTMTSSKYIELPQYKNDMLLFDYVTLIEHKLYTNWNKRKLFIQELQNISTVIEFDPIDFSYVAICIKLTKDKLFVLCTVEIRLSDGFPISAPLLVVNDIQNSGSYPLENISLKINNSWSCERMAREYFIHICQQIYLISFGQIMEVNSKNIKS